MKNLFKYICICVLATTLASCVGDGNVKDTQNITTSQDKGVLTLNIDTRAEGAQNIDYILRIYKNESDGTSMLVRKYYSAKNEQPEFIWLLSGNYTATIESGVAVASTFNANEKYFYASETFDIVGGATTNVDMVAVVQNIPVEVVFDSSIVDDFNSGYYVDVVADSTAQLHFTESKKGYIIMPKGVTTLSWRFVGTFTYSDGEVVNLDKSGVIENVELKKGYKLSFRFTKDTTGFLDNISVTVDESVEERYDHISFNPDPEIKGADFNLEETHNYIGGAREYVAKSPAAFNKVLITADNKEYDPTISTIAGITLTGLNTTELHITLSDDFFNSLRGGSQTISMYVEDADGGSVLKRLPYNLQGAYNADVNLWGGVATLSATVFDTSSTVELACRTNGGEWVSYAAAASANNTYKANVSDLKLGSTYEYSLVVNGKHVGASCTFKTEQGNQIPNGGLEDWCKSDKVIIPWKDGNSPYWCSGNYGTTTLGEDWNITQSSTDVRPNSTGTKSAYMKSANILNLKFAAGNMYVGAWGGMNGMNAQVYFGQPFTYNAKPKAIRFWAKYNCGTIDVNPKGITPSSNKDLAKIFCCMTTDRHLVDSSKPDETTFSPSYENIKSGDARYKNVLYSAYMETSESQTEWKQFEIPFTFYGSDPNQVPTYIILTFTCSGYGDYFGGSTSSWMYVDDVELVY